MAEGKKCFFELSEDKRKARCERYVKSDCHFRAMRRHTAEFSCSPCFRRRASAPLHMYRTCGGMGRLLCGSEDRGPLGKAFSDLLQTEEGKRFREMFCESIRPQRMCTDPPAESGLPKKGANTTRIAVPYENGTIRPSFGGVQEFKIYDVADKKIVAEKVIDNGRTIHADLVCFLASNETDVVICQNIGSNGYDFFLKNHIKIYIGASGPADQAVQSFLDGTLDLSAEPSGCGNGCGSSDSLPDRRDV